MAIPDNYIDKITNKDSGESRIISPAADKVRVDNENFDGTDLDEVLDEVAESISEHHGLVNGRVPFDEATPIVLASLDGDNTDITPYSEGDYFAVLSSEKIYQVVNGTADEVGEIDDKLIYCDKSDSTLYRWNGSQFVQVGGNSGGGDGTVTGVKVGNTTYEPTDGVVDLSTPFAGKVDKNGTDSLMTAAEHTKLQNLPTNEQLTQQLGNKANDTDVVKSISVNGGSAQTPQNGNVNIQVSAGDQVSVIQPDPADGTFTIHVGSNDYTINLNHTHENMAKIVKCTEATLPQTLADDTIYVQVDNETTPTDIECLYLFGLEFTGGGLPAGVPQISKPTYGSTINLGTLYGQGSATGTVKIKGRSLTANSTVVVSVGSGFSLSYGQQSGSSINIDAADVVLGCDVTVYATAYGTEGAMIIASQTDNISVEVELTSEVVEELAGVKLTGTQWLETDYHTNPQTKIVMDCLFEKNSVTENKSYSGTRGQNVFSCRDSEESALYLNMGSPAEQIARAYDMMVWLQRGYDATAYNHIYSHSFNNENTFCNRSTLTIDAPNKFISFQGVSWATDTKTNTQTVNFVVGISQISQAIFNCFDLTIYSLKLYNGSTLVRDYSPKRINGVVGLLDSVDGGFISSKTQTALEPITTV